MDLLLFLRGALLTSNEFTSPGESLDFHRVGIAFKLAVNVGFEQVVHSPIGQDIDSSYNIASFAGTQYFLDSFNVLALAYFHFNKPHTDFRRTNGARARFNVTGISVGENKCASQIALLSSTLLTHSARAAPSTHSFTLRLRASYL